MVLAQILSGADSISCYKRGIEAMLVARRTQPQPPTISSSTLIIPPMIEQQLCHAFCALSELYMTDSCYDDNAESECERFLDAALTHNPHSAEAYYIKASMRVSQQRNADALTELRKSYGLWKAKADKQMQVAQSDAPDEHDHTHEHGPECNHGGEDDEAAFLIPAYPIRHGIAKLFVELGEYKEALPILEGLVMAQDEVPSVWYTYAQAHYKLLDYTNAFECLVTAKGLIAKGEGMGINEEEDSVLVEGVTNLDKEVKQKLAEQGVSVDTEDTMDDDDDS
jgi:tetratricopeptide (TPR) repeat protein